MRRCKSGAQPIVCACNVPRSLLGAAATVPIVHRAEPAMGNGPAAQPVPPVPSYMQVHLTQCSTLPTTGWGRRAERGAAHLLMVRRVVPWAVGVVVMERAMNGASPGANASCTPVHPCSFPGAGCSAPEVWPFHSSPSQTRPYAALHDADSSPRASGRAHQAQGRRAGLNIRWSPLITRARRFATVTRLSTSEKPRATSLTA